MLGGPISLIVPELTRLPPLGAGSLVEPRLSLFRSGLGVGMALAGRPTSLVRPNVERRGVGVGIDDSVVVSLASSYMSSFAPS